jgi:uncharacterized protein YjbI with pentapeptide repeats
MIHANPLAFCLFQSAAGLGRLAKAPETVGEKLFVAALACVGVVLAIRLSRPLFRAVRALEVETQKQRSRGGRFLERAALRGRDLRGMNLANASLRDADLSDTDLRGVDLRGADLQGANLVRARYDAQTQWPDDFDPSKRGAVRAD